METMHFTYSAYADLIGRCKQKGHKFIHYDYQPPAEERVVILRHDIDTSIEKACEMAELEKQLGVISTYFVLVSSDFYNVFSKQSFTGLQAILDCGHEIGLHFDEARYPDIMGSAEKCAEYILREAKVLETAIQRPVTKFSYHRPSKEILEANLYVPDMINSYAPKFFHEYKYLSDSRRRWREPVLDIIECGEEKHLHILTHAFWYQDDQENLHDTIKRFVNGANGQRYEQLRDNITDLPGILPREEVL